MKQFWFKGMAPNNMAPPQKVQQQDSRGNEIQARRAQLENERMTRRQALRSIGVMTGVAVLGLVSADDLARLAASALKSNAVTKEIGDGIARDFRDAGVAFADPPAGPYDPPINYLSEDVQRSCVGLNPNNASTSDGRNCQQCANALGAEASVQNILSAMASAGCPGDATTITLRASQCSMDIEVECNSYPSVSLAIQNYLSCLINGTRDDYELGLIYNILVGVL